MHAFFTSRHFRSVLGLCRVKGCNNDRHRYSSEVTAEIHDADIAHIDLIINTLCGSMCMKHAGIDSARHLLWYVFCMCFMAC